MSEKPREFRRVTYIKYEVDQKNLGSYSSWTAKFPNTIHVIEKSAYDAVVEENERLKKELRNFKDLTEITRKALEREGG